MPIFQRLKIIGVGISIVFLVAVILFIRHIAHPRIVSSAITPDGTELCIVQECNWSPELFTTSFVYHKPGSQWQRFYYDHQDHYWSHARVSMNTNRNTAVFYRGDQPAVTFNWKTEVYTLHRFSRTLTNGQWVMPAGWNPRMSR